MKRSRFPLFGVISAAVVLAFSCATPPEPEEPQTSTETGTGAPEKAAEEPQTEPVLAAEETESVSDNEPEPEAVPDVEPQDAAEEVFSVSEEVFSETFEDIRNLIDELNAIIRDENYDRWLRYLTETYKTHFSSATVLKENSEQPLLKKYNIQLSTLRDYFVHVVVPSRSNARLDDLVFIDNEHVKAIMIFNDKRTILYQLEKSDQGWKIGL